MMRMVWAFAVEFTSFIRKEKLPPVIVEFSYLTDLHWRFRNRTVANPIYFQVVGCFCAFAILINLLALNMETV